MTEFVYKDYLPANARVVIDYTAHEKVKFSYPIDWSYWKAVWRRAYPTIACFWLNLHVTVIFYAALYIGFPFLLIRAIFFPYITIETTTIYHDFIHNVLPLIITIFYVMGIPAIVTLILARDKEKLAKWMPKIGYWAICLRGAKKEAIFKPENVKDKKAILSTFSNVYLNYKCTGDFNKYLEKVEILEIPFTYIRRRFFFPLLKKKEKNDFDFRAVFYFSDEIKEGEMYIEFH